MNAPFQPVCVSPTPQWTDVRGLRVAVVDEDVPFPVTSGKSIRTVQLLTRLARRHRITLLCHRNRDPMAAREGTAFLADHGIATVFAERAAPPRSVAARGPRFYARLAFNLFSPLPYTVQTNCSDALRRAVENHAANHAVDLWHCEWTPMAETLRGLRGVPSLVVAHNIESLIWQRYHEVERNLFRRWYIKRQWEKFEHFEKRAFATATRTVAVSEADAALARERFGAERIEVVDNGVDTSYFRPTETVREPGRILFLGSLDWRPNLDAVAQLLDTIFPAVRAAIPSACLSLVGRNPPQWLVERVQRLPNVELVADVPDVRPHLARCGVMAVPLRIGGGSRLKILEALATATPVISTRVGAEGLAVAHDRHLVIVEEIQEMAAALSAAIHAPERLRTMANAGRRLVEQRYDWERLAHELERIWQRCASEA